MLEHLFEELAALTPAEVREGISIQEIDDLCHNKVFRLLCDLCNAIHPPEGIKGIR